MAMVKTRTCPSPSPPAWQRFGASSGHGARTASVCLQIALCQLSRSSAHSKPGARSVAAAFAAAQPPWLPLLQKPPGFFFGKNQYLSIYQAIRN